MATKKRTKNKKPTTLPLFRMKKLRKQTTLYYTLFLLTLLVSAVSCSTTKYVGEGEYLLTNVSLDIDDKQLKESDFTPFISQKPNHKTFNLIGFPLFFYNLSGSDTTRWVNRWLRNIGTAPVIYNPDSKERSEREIAKALANKGYVHADIFTEEVVEKNKKIKVNYYAIANDPYYLNSIVYHIPDSNIARIVTARNGNDYLLKKSMTFDRSILDSERQRIATLLHNNGYYTFNKEYINYTADTTQLGKRVHLQLNINTVPVGGGDTIANNEHPTYRVRDVFFVTNYNPMAVETVEKYVVRDTVNHNGYYILYGEDQFINKETLVNSCYIEPNSTYSSRAVDNTYSAFSRLRVLKYVNILFQPAENSDNNELDCFILLSEGDKQTLSAELEGTNSSGDLGFATALTYQHRNIFGGSQTLSTKFRASYESLSGDISSLMEDNYTELSGEIGISFPQFIFPFLSPSTRKKLRATTELTSSTNYQQQPEYTRLIVGAGWGYKWNAPSNNQRHTFDLIDVSYVFLPTITDEFQETLDELAEDNPTLWYSYENHFIVRTSHVYYRSNLNANTNASNARRNFYTLRTATEVAGNTLYAFSSLSNQEKDENDAYTIFGIQYSQYAKINSDYAYNIILDERNSIALHAGAGVAIPYANSDVIPFEERFLSGGANSVRGWSVRELGPGTYEGSSSSMVDFMNQCGDIRLDLNLEYRSKLVWVMELAAFVDAGNIWTIKEYSAQPGGEFKFDSFYKEIALAYGLGVRFDFDFFLLRLDWGIRAYDPSLAEGSRWIVPNTDIFSNSTLHFAVGYPF